MSTLNDNSPGPPGGVKAPAERPGGRKVCIFKQFYNDFAFSMHLAPWLMGLGLGGAHGGPCVGL